MIAFASGLLLGIAAMVLTHLMIERRLTPRWKLRAILFDAIPPGIEDWCDECGGKDVKCPANCWVRRARAALKGKS